MTIKYYCRLSQSQNVKYFKRNAKGDANSSSHLYRIIDWRKNDYDICIGFW